MARRAGRTGLVLIVVVGLVLVLVPAAGVAALGLWAVPRLTDRADEPSAADAAHEIARAVSTNDFAALCEMYADASRADAWAAVGAESCEEFVRGKESTKDVVANVMEVVTVEEHDDSATVAYDLRAGNNERSDELTLVLEDGEWLISGTPDFRARYRPGRAELVAALVESGELSPRVADCVAGELLDSWLNDAELVAIVTDDRTRLTDSQVVYISEVMADAIRDCGGPSVAS